MKNKIQIKQTYTPEYISGYVDNNTYLNNYNNISCIYAKNSKLFTLRFQYKYGHPGAIYVSNLSKDDICQIVASIQVCQEMVDNTANIEKEEKIHKIELKDRCLNCGAYLDDKDEPYCDNECKEKYFKYL